MIFAKQTVVTFPVPLVAVAEVTAVVLISGSVNLWQCPPKDVALQ